MWDSLLSFLFLEEKEFKKNKCCLFFVCFCLFCLFLNNQQGFERCFKWSVLYMNMNFVQSRHSGRSFSDERRLSTSAMLGHREGLDSLLTTETRIQFFFCFFFSVIA